MAGLRGPNNCRPQRRGERGGFVCRKVKACAKIVAKKRGWTLLINALGMESYTIVKKSLLSKIFRKEGPIHPMNKLFQATLLTTVFVVSSHAQTITTTTFGSGANEFNIEFVEIGETGLDPNDYGRGQVN